MYGSLLIDFSSITGNLSDIIEVRQFLVDLEGTMVDTDTKGHLPAHIRTIEEVFKIFLPSDINEICNLFEHFSGGPDSLIYKEVRAYIQSHKDEIQKHYDEQNLLDEHRNPLSVDTLLEKWTVENLMLEKQRLFEQWFKGVGHLEPREGFRDFYHQIVVPSGIPFMICSVSQNLQVEKILEKSGLKYLVDSSRVLDRSDVQDPKPNPRVYLRAAELKQIPIEFAMIVEDSPSGLQTGNNALGYTPHEGGKNLHMVCLPVSIIEGKTTTEAMKIKLEGYQPGLKFDNWNNFNDYIMENAYVEEKLTEPVEYETYMIAHPEAVSGRFRFNDHGQIVGMLKRAFAGKQISPEGSYFGLEPRSHSADMNFHRHTGQVEA